MNKLECVGSERHMMENRKIQVVLGRLKLTYLLHFFIPILIFAPLFSYYMAVKYKQAGAYPHTTITNMSRFYPQDVVFRFLMLPSGFFLNICYLVLSGWMKSLKKQTKYPGSTQPWLLFLGQWSIIGYYLAIATIDGGSLPLIHIIGALFFFLVLFLITISTSLILRNMHKWCSTIITPSSLIIKLLLAAYLLLIFLYCLFGVLFELLPQNQDNKYMVIFEWNLILGCLIWLYTFTFEWNNIHISLKYMIK